jgi:hypothetical protein
MGIGPESALILWLVICFNDGMLINIRMVAQWYNMIIKGDLIWIYGDLIHVISHIDGNFIGN